MIFLISFLLQAVRLVTELCLEYKIYDLQLWNGLLQKLLGFSMVRLCALDCSLRERFCIASLKHCARMLVIAQMYAANIHSPWFCAKLNLVLGQRKCWLKNDIISLETNGSFPDLFWYLSFSEWTSLVVLMVDTFYWSLFENLRIWYFMLKFSILVIFWTCIFFFPRFLI